MSTLLDLQNKSEGDPPPEHGGLPKPKYRWWSRVVIPATIVVVGGVLLLLSAWKSLLPLPEVQVESVVVKEVNESTPAGSQVQAAGWLEASPYLHNVPALTGGMLKEILVLEGEPVKKGQVVARMIDDDAKLDLAQADATLALRQASVGVAKARRDAAESSWKYPIALEREAAVYGARLEEARAAVAVAEARIEEQRVTLVQARRDVKRAQELHKSGTISKQEAEVAENKVMVSAAALLALQKMHQKAEAEVKSAAAQATAAKSDLKLRIDDRRERDAATAALKRAEAEVKVAEAHLAIAKLRHSRMEIVSPVDGIVVKRLKEPGDKAMPHGESMQSATIISVYDPSKLQARVDVPLADAAKIAIGQRCEVASEVLPNKKFAGRVDRVLHSADIQKNTLEVKVVLDAPSNKLRPEMLCRVRFLAQPRKKVKEKAGATAIFAPREASREGKFWVLKDYNGQYGKARSIPAEATAELDGWIAVSGLVQGDRVIVSSSTPLKEGQRVRLAKEAR